MDTPEIKVVKLSPSARLPSYAHEGDAGADLYASAGVIIPPGGRALVPTGIAVAIPQGWEGQVRPRSGLALKHGITVLNAPGTVDSSYRGEIGVILANTDKEKPFAVSAGDRIAQLVIARAAAAVFTEAEELPDTVRGGGGFGSTGLGG